MQRFTNLSRVLIAALVVGLLFASVLHAMPGGVRSVPCPVECDLCHARWSAVCAMPGGVRSERCRVGRARCDAQ